MIRIKMNSAAFKSETEKIMSSLNSTVSVSNVNEIAKAAGSIAMKEFIKSLNREARANKSQYHHIYEWGEVGRDEARLFKVKKTVSGGKANLDISLKKSKKKVPIAKELLRPGKTGKIVTRTSVFRDKAMIMETGKPVSWVSKRTVAFVNNRSILFKAKGTAFNNLHPGGTRVTGSLERYARKWEVSGMAESAMEKSKIFSKIEKDVAKTLSGTAPSASEIRKCIKTVCQQYDIKGEL